VIVAVTLTEKASALFGRSLSLRFLIIGIANTCFSTLLFMILLYVGFGVVVGSALALALGVLFSYYTQGTIVFRHKSLGAFVRFVLAWIVIYLANLGEIRIFQHLGFNKYLAGTMATVPTTVVSYFVQKLLVFRVNDRG